MGHTIYLHHIPKDKYENKSYEEIWNYIDTNMDKLKPILHWDSWIFGGRYYNFQWQSTTHPMLTKLFKDKDNEEINKQILLDNVKTIGETIKILNQKAFDFEEIGYNIKHIFFLNPDDYCVVIDFHY
jgi:hypothetical protein